MDHSSEQAILDFLMMASYITGRLKDLIILRGVNHYPQDIEATVERSHIGLRAHSGAAITLEVDGKDRDRKSTV